MRHQLAQPGHDAHHAAAFGEHPVSVLGHFAHDVPVSLCDKLPEPAGQGSLGLAVFKGFL
jgi:hypothetical protein